MIDPERYKPRTDDDDTDGGDAPRQVVDRDEESLDQLLESYSEAGNFVYLRRHELGEWVFLAKLEVADAKLESIQSRFGGGKFRVQIIDGETNRQKIQRTFRIAGKPKNDDEETEIVVAPAPAPAPAPTMNGNGDHVSLADVLKIAMTALTARPTVDPLMQTLITALVGRGKSGDSVDPLELQKLLQQAEDRGYQRGRELGEAIAGAGGEGDGVARALAANLPAVVDAFKSAQQSYTQSRPRPAAPAPAAIPAPATSTPSAPTETETPTTEGEAMGMGWINALRPAVPVIVQWAKQQKDPAVKAANTIDDLRDDIRDAIALQAEEPDFVGSVIRAIPEFQAPDVQSFVTVFLSTIQEILTTPDDEGVLGGEVNEA